MAITASEVNKLRQQTGAGMMDCKNALVESNGDFETAVDVLRKKGQKIAAKRGENDAKEGIIIAQSTEDSKAGVIVTLNCETDFVAKNSGYVQLVQSLVDLALDSLPKSLDELKGLAYNEKLSVEEKITEQIGILGEKLDLSAYALLESEKVVAYNHPGNQLATLVALNINSDNADDAGKQVAMQVAAMNPIAVNKDGIDSKTIEREIEVGKDQAIQEGKPAEMAEKIENGKDFLDSGEIKSFEELKSKKDSLKVTKKEGIEDESEESEQSEEEIE